MHSKIAGAMLGLACGDALGAPAEFKSLQELRERWGVLTEMTGGSGWQPGEWTDDTAMALCVAEGILERPDDPVMPIGERFLQWYRTDPKDIGNTTRAALSAFAGDWARASSGTHAAKSGKAAANGSLMRTLAVALAYPERDVMLAVSARVSAMTHWDAQAEACCAIYCLWVAGLLAGVPPSRAWQEAIGQAREAAARSPLSPVTPGCAGLADDWWERFAGVEKKRYTDLQPTGYAGYVVDCLEAAAWCCLKAHSLEQALILSVNLAGEADTIAAVAGGAAGAIWGVEGVPKRWLGVLHQRDRLERVARGLADLRRHHEVYAMIVPDGYTGEPRRMKALEFNEVADRVYAGRNPLTVPDVERLRAEGITHIVDLREPREWTPPKRAGAEAIEAAERLGVVRRHLQVDDMEAPRPEVLTAVSDCLDEWLADPANRVYVHCRAGIERTGAVLVAWYARKHGVGYTEALAALKRGRDILKPMDHQADAVRDWLKAQRGTAARKEDRP